MRKFLILVAIVMLLVGLRLHFNWVAYVDRQGTLTVFHDGGAISIYSEIPTLLTTNESVRLDILGGEEDAQEILVLLDAKTLWTEHFESLTVIYAHSSRIAGSQIVLGKQVNLMLAINQKGIAIGSPILKGSY